MIILSHKVFLQFLKLIFILASVNNSITKKLFHFPAFFPGFFLVLFFPPGCFKCAKKEESPQNFTCAFLLFSEPITFASFLSFNQLFIHNGCHCLLVSLKDFVERLGFQRPFVVWFFLFSSWFKRLGNVCGCILWTYTYWFFSVWDCSSLCFELHFTGNNYFIGVFPQWLLKFRIGFTVCLVQH